jgi:hypothetical protein
LEREPIDMPVRKVGSAASAYLGLEGTVLLVKERQAAIDSEAMIPVELVSISEGRRYDSRRLIAAVLSLFTPVLLSIGALLLLCDSGLLQEPYPPVSVILMLVLLCLPLLGPIAFLVLLVIFLFRVKTVRLDVGADGSRDATPGGMTIEFYRKRKHRGQDRCFPRADSRAAGHRKRVPRSPREADRRLCERALGYPSVCGPAVTGRCADAHDASTSVSYPAGRLHLTRATHIKARALVGAAWSALQEAVFIPGLAVKSSGR